MKVLSIVGATLLVTSFHVAAFVSASSVPVEHKANVTSKVNNVHAIPSEAANAIPIAGCNCAFCSSLRGVSL